MAGYMRRPEALSLHGTRLALAGPHDAARSPQERQADPGVTPRGSARDRSPSPVVETEAFCPAKPGKSGPVLGETAR